MLKQHLFLSGLILNQAEIDDQVSATFEGWHRLAAKYPAARRHNQPAVISLDNGLTAENKTLLRNTFPSGDFLLHGTKVSRALAVVGEGSLRSQVSMIKARDAGEVDSGKAVFSNGGSHAISWNFNGSTVLPGDPGHLTFFVTSPKVALERGHKLAIGRESAIRELQLFHESVDVKSLVHHEAQESFWLGADGVASSIRNLLRDFLAVYKGTTPLRGSELLFRDFRAVADGTLSIDLVRSLYSEVGPTIELAPHFDEDMVDRPWGVSPSLILFDAMLRRAGDRDLAAVVRDCFDGPEPDYRRLSRRFLEAFDVIGGDMAQAAVDQILSVNKSMMAAGTATVPVDGLLLFVPSNDAVEWTKAVEVLGAPPAAIVGYRSEDGPVSGSWLDPTTQPDSAKAARCVREVLNAAGVPRETLDYHRILGNRNPQLSQKVKVRSEDVLNAGELNLVDGAVKLTPPSRRAQTAMIRQNTQRDELAFQ